MARLTVEDCIQVVPNRYELVLLGAQRARDLAVRAKPTVPWDRDKRSVVALREIAEGTLDPAEVREALVRSLQRQVDEDSLPEDADSSRSRTVVVGVPGDRGSGLPGTVEARESLDDHATAAIM